MLPSIQDALAHKGRRNVAIARDLDRAAITVTLWFSGKLYIPLKIRRALDTAMGHPIDWPAYELEYAAEHDRRYAAKADAPPRPARPAAPPAPAAPVKVPANPAKLTATPPRPAPDPVAPTPVSGFLSRLFPPSSEDLFQ